MLNEQHYQFQAKSMRHKRVLSILFVGLHMLKSSKEEYLKVYVAKKTI